MTEGGVCVTGTPTPTTEPPASARMEETTSGGGGDCTGCNCPVDVRLSPQKTSSALLATEEAQDGEELRRPPVNRYVVASPGYPGHYPANATCEWRFTAAGGGKLRIEMSGVDLEWSRICRQGDHVFLGHVAGHGRLWLCGHNFPAGLLTQVSDGDRMEVRFVSDRAGADKGFRAVVRAIGG